MSDFDFLAVPLKCLRCGQTSSAELTRIQTKMAEHPAARDLRIGDSVGVLDPSALEEEGYWTLHAQGDGEPLRILEAWDCPPCDSRLNWAEAVIEDGRLTAVQAVRLDAATLARAHFLSAGGAANAGVLLGVEVGARPREQVLREFLTSLSGKRPKPAP